MSKFYVTTPIYYVNSVPHIGHAYTTIAADILARYYRQKGDIVYFQTGTDEHGAKIAQAADKQGLAPQEFVDKIVPQFEKTWEILNIDYDFFIRTTDKNHKKIVGEILSLIKANGDIYKDRYEGLYCVHCERFYTEGELENGLCIYHQEKPTFHQETNYFFKLSRYRDKLLRALEDKSDPNYYEILPRARRNEIIGKIKSGLQDISISRETLAWGVKVPWDEKQVVYVWVEALLNYFSGPKIARKDVWPPDVQIIGKDILWFHAVIWPAMLMSAGVSLPKKIFAHGFFTIDGQKISKTLGNVIDPVEVSKKYGIDALRYFLFSEVSFGDDGIFSLKRLEERYSSDLSNGLGNLVQRVAAMVEKYLDGEIFRGYSEVDSAPFERHMEELEFHKAIEYIWSELKGLDQYIEEEKPWRLAKENNPRLPEVLGNLMASIQELNKMIAPFMPETGQKIDEIFGGNKVKLKEPLFPRIDE